MRWFTALLLVACGWLPSGPAAGGQPGVVPVKLAVTVACVQASPPVLLIVYNNPGNGNNQDDGLVSAQVTSWSRHGWRWTPLATISGGENHLRAPGWTTPGPTWVRIVHLGHVSPPAVVRSTCPAGV